MEGFSSREIRREARLRGAGTRRVKEDGFAINTDVLPEDAIKRDNDEKIKDLGQEVNGDNEVVKTEMLETDMLEVTQDVEDYNGYNNDDHGELHTPQSSRKRVVPTHDRSSTEKKRKLLASESKSETKSRTTQSRSPMANNNNNNNNKKKSEEHMEDSKSKKLRDKLGITLLTSKVKKFVTGKTKQPQNVPSSENHSSTSRNSKDSKLKPADEGEGEGKRKVGDKLSFVLNKVPQRAGGHKRVNAFDVISSSVQESIQQLETTSIEPNKKKYISRALDEYSALLNERIYKQIDMIDVNHSLTMALRRAETNVDNLRRNLLDLRQQRNDLQVEMDSIRTHHQADIKTRLDLRDIGAFKTDVDSLNTISNSTKDQSTNNNSIQSIMGQLTSIHPLLRDSWGSAARLRSLNDRLSELDKELTF